MTIRAGFSIQSLFSVVLLVALITIPAAHVESDPPPVMTDQGPRWTSAARKDFYSRDQGSRIMPLRWMAALKQANGEPFLAASLSRYGYLPNEDSQPPGLPVGFTVANGESGQAIGMTCSACHTRQIDVAGTSYRIDGGPAIVDLQTFLADLDTAVNDVLTHQEALSDFAEGVLGPSPPPAKVAQLRKEVSAWFLRYHTLIERALPKEPWGVARIDAVSMIFNRLTGLDIGPPPTYLIPDNIKPAMAPVRYPFLWNASIQDKTQWPGFADNGSSILALARNLGEVIGVFAVFHPKKDPGRLLGIDYLGTNSANFEGLSGLEELVRKLAPPKWPWTVDQELASQGKAIFERSTGAGGCVECHGIRPGPTRFPDDKTWATPVQDVGTDSREHDVLGITVETGVLTGARIPFLTEPLKPTDTALNVLRLAGIGAILQHYTPVVTSAKAQEATVESAKTPFTRATEDLRGAFNAPPPSLAYESRVLEGIWAAAPYLHNGSVPTLAELLKPAAERVAEFEVGPAYDPVTVGLAASQTRFNYTLKTTDCSARNSGNSRCGHEFGTTLSPADKRALLEYLKIL